MKPVIWLTCPDGEPEVWPKCKCRAVLRVRRGERAVCLCGQPYEIRDRQPAKRTVVIGGEG